MNFTRLNDFDRSVSSRGELDPMDFSDLLFDSDSVIYNSASSFFTQVPSPSHFSHFSLLSSSDW